MTYTRKTRDEWQLWVNYGQGFEEVTAAETYREIKSLAKDYRDNEPMYPRQIKCKRVLIKKATVTK